MSEPASSSAPSGLTRTAHYLTRIALIVGILCCIASVAAGLGAKQGLWHFRVGFDILKYSTYAGFGVLALAVIGTIIALAKHQRESRNIGLLALLFSVIVCGPPLYQLHLVNSNPKIHDISTDLLNPPSYVAVVALRNKDDNSLAIDPEVQKQQAAAFPDIRPVKVATAPQQVLKRAEETARQMGWDIDNVDTQAMSLEATATTMLFGFKDDVVIRVAPDGAGSVMDIRSASRVGKSDVGVNARRVRAFIRKFNGD